MFIRVGVELEVASDLKMGLRLCNTWSRNLCPAGLLVKNINGILWNILWKFTSWTLRRKCMHFNIFGKLFVCDCTFLYARNKWNIVHSAPWMTKLRIFKHLVTVHKYDTRYNSTFENIFKIKYLICLYFTMVLWYHCLYSYCSLVLPVLFFNRKFFVFFAVYCVYVLYCFWC